MKPAVVPVLSNREIMPQVYLIWAKAPQIAATASPGQFVMVRCGQGYDPLLRRPFSIHRVGQNGEIAFLYQVVGRGTQWLSYRRPGDTLDLLGPLGKGFVISPYEGLEDNRLLLIAGGIGIAPLIFLAEKALEGQCVVTLFIGAKNADLVYPGELLPSLVEVAIATEDGSLGEKGRITELIPRFSSQARQIFACGPISMYQSLVEQDWLKEKSVQVSLETRMGCGQGICYGCTIKTSQGLKQVCRDGPVFELKDVVQFIA
jgi:dihydroorotate dehydrogenase electron transfer subunit